MKQQRKVLSALLGITVLATLVGVGVYYNSLPSADPVEAAKEIPVAEAPVPTVEESYPFVFSSQDTVYSSLKELNVPSPVIQQIARAAKPIFDLARIRPGTRFRVVQDSNPASVISEIQFWFSPLEMLNVKKINGSWEAQKITEKVDIQVVNFAGEVTSSLWESAERADMDPNLIADLAEIFGWQVDFAREVRVNDRWRITVEQKLVKNKPIGWGRILAAEYVNDGQSFEAVLFRHEGQELGYFAPDGTSLRRMFLKSPIRYGRISSRFQKSRFHPILQVNRPHLGVDYAAAIGTPIRAVGDGVILKAGWAGGAGKLIRIRHNSTYETAYKHLNGFAPGVRSGSRVRQGQIIGYVGTTGLSTGPHLHFEFFINGKFVDPLGQKFPSADPIPQNLMAQFKSQSESLLASLPVWGNREVTLRESGRRAATAEPATRN